MTVGPGGRADEGEQEVFRSDGGSGCGGKYDGRERERGWG